MVGVNGKGWGPIGSVNGGSEWEGMGSHWECGQRE